MYKKIILTAVLLLSLMGCATGKLYETPDTLPSQRAIIRGFDHSVSAWNWHNGKVVAIDGKTVVYSIFILDDFSYNIPVLPGSHVFTIKSTFNKSATLFSSQGPYEATASIQGTLAAGKGYHLNGIIKEAAIELWIEDDSGKRISYVVTPDYHLATPSLITSSN
ncbi:MAG: hypothetical protein A3E83_06320 [Gammaproteobacteria bacterium RIFCSPHIGHO2_12_FULL_41_20]|nr:MAG: hypothetical protein A3E83_06320 [Gammaproteobacteria bacterium RIFCSPHIGHO2_12_FULL_41_20]